MSDDWTHDEDYSRVRFHVQRGDGVDNRGDVTVEVSRNSDAYDTHHVREEAEAEFTRAVAFLEDEILGLEDDDDD